jgi:peptide/nickel transport system permease protein
MMGARPAAPLLLQPMTPELIQRKAVRYVIVLFIIVSLNFFIPRWMPGDPLMNLIGEEAFYGSGEALEALRVKLGLDGPRYVQFARYLRNLFTGDWGYSYLYMRPVLQALVPHLRWTLLLVLPATLLGALIATFWGVLVAWHRKSLLDIGVSSLFLFIYSMPGFWLAMVVLFLFGFRLAWFPLGKVYSGERSGLALVLDVGWHMVLPLAVLTVSKASHDFLVVRNAVVAVLSEDYILTARAKGLSSHVVLYRHVLKNALAPLITVTAIQLGAVLSGALLVEVVFSWPGMGSLIYAAIGARDYPLLQGAFFIIALCMLMANFVADLLYNWLDPRTR